MIRYVNASKDSSYYIGGDLYEINFDNLNLNDILEQRAEEIYEFLEHCSDYYVCYRPDNEYGQYSILSNRDIDDLFDSMAIKDGVNVIYIDKHIEVIAYYNGRSEIAYLYPILPNKARMVQDYLDEHEFDDLAQIDKFIKEFCNL